MSYGLQVFSDSNTVQIDSDKTYSYYKVTQASSGTTVTTTDRREVVFIKPVNGTTASNDIWGASTVPNGNGFIYTFKRGTTTTSVDYFVVRHTRADTATTGYGLRVYNVDSQLAFDSGVFTNILRKTIYIKTVSPIGRSGNPANSTSIVYSLSDYLTTYASLVGTNQFTNNGGTSSSGFLVWGYNSSTTIRCFNYFDLGAVSGPGYVVPLGQGFITTPSSIVSAVLIA